MHFTVPRALAAVLAAVVLALAIQMVATVRTYEDTSARFSVAAWTVMRDAETGSWAVR